jgi:hypothetical protein
MKDAEDEAFDELAKRQGHWGGGYQAKKAMAADKLQEPVCDKDPQDCWNVRCQLGKQCKNLAQPAQKPIAWRWGNKKLNGGYEWRYTTYKTQPDAIPLYAAPPQRPWVGLTEEDFSAINQSCLTKLQAATSAESILKKKNS